MWDGDLIYSNNVRNVTFNFNAVENLHQNSILFSEFFFIF